jgi:drug/metabolite transporter (DMT)-like permease
MSTQSPQLPLPPVARRPQPQIYPSTLLNSPPLRNEPLLPKSQDTIPALRVSDEPSSSISHYISSYIPSTYLDVVDQNMGLLLVAVSQLFFSAMGISAKYFLSTTGLSVVTLIFVRMAITSIFCTITLLFLKNPYPFLGPPEMRRLLLLRGTFGFVGLLSSYQSLKGLSVSDSMTIQYLTPALTGVLGWVLLGEKLKGREVGVGVACLVGVVLVSRPPFIFGKIEEVVPGSERPGMGRLPVPGGVQMEDNGKERMIAVGWALMCVFASAGAC